MLNAYTLTFGGLLLLGGRAGDILGRRRMFIAGILIFTLASFLGGLATSSAWLLAARALQGVGGAITAPTALALITTNFAEGPERNRAFGVFGAVAGAGGAIGLLAGGMLTSWLSWRWVLFVNVPIGVLLASLAPLYITESERQPGRFDLAPLSPMHEKIFKDAEREAAAHQDRFLYRNFAGGTLETEGEHGA